MSIGKDILEAESDKKRYIEDAKRSGEEAYFQLSLYNKVDYED